MRTFHHSLKLFLWVLCTIAIAHVGLVHAQDPTPAPSYPDIAPRPDAKAAVAAVGRNKRTA